MDADTPSQPFGGPEEIAFTPDGKGIVFAAENVGRGEAWSTNFDLYYAPVDGSAAPRSLTEENKAWDSYPAFSPDGKTLAYLAMSRPGYEADQFRIMLMDWPDRVAQPPSAGKKLNPPGAGATVAPAWDRSASAIGWSADGKSIYAIAANTGQESLFSIDVKSGNTRTMVKEGTVHSFSVARGRSSIAWAICGRRRSCTVCGIVARAASEADGHQQGEDGRRPHGRLRAVQLPRLER